MRTSFLNKQYILNSIQYVLQNNNVFFLVIASCLFFMAGPIGALEQLIGSKNTYLLRFMFVSMGLLLSGFASINSSNSVSFYLKYIYMLLFFLSSILITFFLNPTPVLYVFGHVLGIITWIIFGISVSNSTKNHAESLTSIITGYFMANTIFAFLFIVYVVFNIDNSFNPDNNRLLGPFDTSTIVSEIFYPIMLLGLLLIYYEIFFIGLMVTFLAYAAVLLTGVRTSIAFSGLIIIIFMYFYVKFLNKSVKYRIITLSLLFIYFASLLVLYIFDIQFPDRFSVDYIFNEGRIQIWLYGLEVFDKTKFIFGKGIRVELLSYLPMYEGYHYGSIAWHNTWLALFLETGVVGLMSVLIIIFIVIKKVIRTYKLSKRNNDFRYIFLIGILCVCFRYIALSFTEMNLYTALSPGIMLFFSLYGAQSVKNSLL